MQHSPHPWRLGPHNRALLDADSRRIATLEYDATETDGRLLAEAPRMLLQLRGLLTMLEHAPDGRVVIEEGGELHHEILETLGRCADGR
jgi:hypothetical protein